MVVSIPSRGPAWYAFRIGSRNAWILSDGPLGQIPPAEEFPGAPEADMTALLARHHLPTDHLSFEQNCLVLETDQGLALFDTGMGSSDLFGPYAGRLLSAFDQAGLDARAVSAVFLTHAHPDHLFGLNDAQGRSTFPGAQVYISRADFDFWTSDETAARNPFFGLNVDGARERLTPYSNSLRFIEDGEEPIPGIKAMSTPGHTVGHLSYLIESDGERCLVLGDTAYHFAVSFAHPEWHSSYDTDPVLAARTRAQVLGYAADQGMRVAGYHFPFPGLGFVDRVGQAYRYTPQPMDFR